MKKGNSEIHRRKKTFRNRLLLVYEYEKQTKIDEEVIDIMAIFGGVLLAITNLYNYLEGAYGLAIVADLVALVMILEPKIRKYAKNFMGILRFFVVFMSIVETLYLYYGSLQGFGNFWFALVDYWFLIILGMRIALWLTIYHSIIICLAFWTPLFSMLPGADIYSSAYRVWFPFIYMFLLALIFYSNVLFKTYQLQNIRDERRLEAEIRKTRRKKENMVLQAVTSISALLDAKDPLTAEHSERVAEYAGLIAKRVGITDEKEINAIIRAGRLHDIGKMAIPDEILTKKGRLTEDEYEIMKKHTVWGRQILHNLTFIPYVEEVAGDHHERMDGHGYPQGLAGEEIPFYARIVSAADSLDAMNSNRCYRNCCAKDYILEQFRQGRGKQFDPLLSDVVCELIEDGSIVIANLGEEWTVTSLDKSSKIGEQEVLETS